MLPSEAESADEDSGRVGTDVAVGVDTVNDVDGPAELDRLADEPGSLRVPSEARALRSDPDVEDSVPPSGSDALSALLSVGGLGWLDDAWAGGSDFIATEGSTGGAGSADAEQEVEERDTDTDAGEPLSAVGTFRVSPFFASVPL